MDSLRSQFRARHGYRAPLSWRPGRLDPGRIVTPGEPGRDAARQGWNLAVDQRPALVTMRLGGALSGVAGRRALRLLHTKRCALPQFHGAPADSSCFFTEADYARMKRIRADANPHELIIASHADLGATRASSTDSPQQQGARHE